MAKTTGVQPKGIWGIFQQDLETLSRRLQGGLTALLNWLFAFNRQGSQRRLNLFIVFTILLWVGLALLAHPLRAGRDPVLLQFISALTSADVLRHFVVLALAMWVGLRMSAIYLDDIFELKNVKIAENFITKAVFPGHYSIITIREGKVALEDQESSLYKIGGPGFVNVHLENVALFEKIDGTPHVLEPSRNVIEPLDGFERCRDVIDLRDQVIELDVVEGRTQDGIIVQAKDVRMVFSIYRGEITHVEGDTFEQPYPFERDAVEALIYKQGPGNWYNAMRYLIIGELRDFIASHTLSEFLANAHLGSSEDDFFPRDKLTNLFYDFTYGFSKRAAERGVQLDWIGVGTWVTPSEIIPARHLEAWKLSCETRALNSPQSFKKIRSEARVAEVKNQVDEIIANFYQMQRAGDELSEKEKMRNLALLYRARLRNVQELYAQEDQPLQPDVEEAIRHITYVTAVRPERKPGDSHD